MMKIMKFCGKETMEGGGGGGGGGGGLLFK